MTKRFSRWILFTALLLVAAGLFYGGLFAGRPVLEAMALRMPENYEYLARRHLEAGELDKALEAVDREIAQNRYNFEARYLKAELLSKAGRNDEALEVLWGLSALHRAILGRTDVPSRGWDEARIHVMLAELLWDEQRYEESLDEMQVAMDWHDPGVELQCRAFVDRIQSSAKGEAEAWAFVGQVILDPDIRLDRLAPRGKDVPLNYYTRLAQIALERDQLHVARMLIQRERAQFPNQLPAMLSYYHFLRQLPAPRTWSGTPGAIKMGHEYERATVGRVIFGSKQTDGYVTSGMWIRLFRNVLADAPFQASRRTRGMCIVARGTVCNEVWPILVVRQGEKRIGRRYIRSDYFQVYTLPIEVGPGVGTIQVGLENDEYNPITRQDRNLEISEIRFY